MADTAKRASSGSGIIARPDSDQAKAISEQKLAADEKARNLNEQVRQLTEMLNSAKARGGPGGGLATGDIANLQAALGGRQQLLKEAQDQAGTYGTQLTAQQDQDKQQADVHDQFANISSQQKSAADQFRTAFPSIVDNQMAPLRSQARRAIAEGTSANKANYNHRGLLYSGLRAGGEADLTGDVSNQLNSARGQINQNLTDTQQKLDQAPIDTGLAESALGAGKAAVDNDYTNNVLNALMNKSQQNNQSVGSLIGAGGALAGTLAGGLIKNPVSDTTKTPGLNYSNTKNWAQNYV